MSIRARALVLVLEAIEPSLASSTELTATTSLADASLSDLSGLTLTSNSDGEKSEDSSFFVPPELPSAKKLSNFQLASRPIQALAARGRAEADVLAPRKRLLLPLEDDVWRGSVDQALEELSATSSGPADA